MSYRVCYACGNVGPNWMLGYLERCWICKIKANHGRLSDSANLDTIYSRYDKVIVLLKGKFNNLKTKIRVMR